MGSIIQVGRLGHKEVTIGVGVFNLCLLIYCILHQTHIYFTLYLFSVISKVETFESDKAGIHGLVGLPYMKVGHYHNLTKLLNSTNSTEDWTKDMFRDVAEVLGKWFLDKPGYWILDKPGY